MNATIDRVDWVSVADRLPDSDEQVIAWIINQRDGYSGYGLARYTEVYRSSNVPVKVWYADRGGDIEANSGERVTHWALLPAPRS